MGFCITMSIGISHITKQFGEQKALNDVSFNVSTGQVVGLLGPNGAGKSTLMRIITGYLTQDGGNVDINGHNTQDTRYDFRRGIGYLPENNPLYPDMYVKEYLSWVGTIYKLGNEKHRRVMELIGITGIGDEQGKKIGYLSKGYRQRVGLAQALIHNPSVLVLDEPTSGLDPNQIVEIRNVIEEIGRNKTVIFSTHIMQEVEAICSRIIIINKGLVVADGTNAEVKALSSGLRQNIVVEFAENVSREAIMAIEGVETATLIDFNRWWVTSGRLEDIRGEIFHFAKNAGFTLLTLQKRDLQLEEVFQNLTTSNNN